MPTLREVIDFMRECAESAGREFTPELAADLEKKVQQRFAAEKIYVPALGSRKDPARAEAIREAARRLPTGVVVQRFGVSKQLVLYHAKKGRAGDD